MKENEKSQAAAIRSVFICVPWDTLLSGTKIAVTLQITTSVKNTDFYTKTS